MGLSSDPERAGRQKAALAAGRAKRAENLAARKTAAAAPNPKRPVVRASASPKPKPKKAPADREPDRDRADDNGSTGGFFRGLFDW